MCQPGRITLGNLEMSLGFLEQNGRVNNTVESTNRILMHLMLHGSWCGTCIVAVNSIMGPLVVINTM